MDAAVKALAADLQRIFGARLQSVVTYGDGGGDGVHTLALVERLTFSDLTACAPRMTDWRRAGAAAPLILTRDEFLRTLDVFPLEYGGIIANHKVVVGEDLLAGMRVSDADLRRGCELQAKSHLIHLREGFLEAGGDLNEVVYLIASSSHAFRSLLSNIARLDGELTTPPYHSGNDDALAKFAERVIDVPASLVHDVFGFRPNSGSIAEPTALLGRYIGATERIWAYVDGWKRR